MKVCTKCSERKSIDQFSPRYDRPNGYRSECKKCQWKMQGARRKKKSGHLARRSVYNKAQYAAKQGVIVTPSLCENCGLVPPTHKHHEDYSNPLDVTHLCEPCHIAHHMVA